jgi:membrane fusion protein, multidrug efflux system
MADGSNNVTRIENRVAPDKPELEQPVEATPASKAPAPAAPAATSAPKKKRSLLRPLLFVLLPVALVAGG